MVAGRGWIALARRVRDVAAGAVLLGAYLFGAYISPSCSRRARERDVPTELLSVLPYIATIVVLVLISRDATLIRLNVPASLGQAVPCRKLNRSIPSLATFI